MIRMIGPARFLGGYPPLPGDACPGRIFPEGWWLREWLKVNKDRGGSISREKAPERGGTSLDVVSAKLAKSGFRYRTAAAAVNAAVKEAIRGRIVSARTGGSRMYVTNGMSREATQEPEGVGID